MTADIQDLSLHNLQCWVKPELPKGVLTRLWNINPHFLVKWDWHGECWQIWHKDLDGVPYVAATTHSFNERFYDNLRFGMWWSMHAMRNAKELNEKRKYAVAKKKKQERELFEDLGKEVRPLMRSLADAGTSSHGKSKFMFEGFGNGANSTNK